MISEGSCATEDRSNDAENSALKQEKHYKILLIYCIFNAALVSRIDFIINKLKET